MELLASNRLEYPANFCHQQRHENLALLQEADNYRYLRHKLLLFQSFLLHQIFAEQTQEDPDPYQFCRDGVNPDCERTQLSLLHV